ncbi:MAG TPA: hypothetical protein DDW50_14795 [Firmicutes bacterium]|jgi:hypothetical protein|nr:hypothetical protein [Bacillota bacterium]
MNFVIINIKNTLPTSPVILTKDSGDKLFLKKGDREIYLDSLDTTVDNVLPDMGSSIGNVIFLVEPEFQIDSVLKTNTESGIFKFKETELISNIDVTITTLGADQVISFYLDDAKIAKRFVEKKICGELYLLNSAEDTTLPFYPQLKEAYIFSSGFVEVGFAGFLECGNTISSPSASITDLTVDATDKKPANIENTGAVFEISLWKKYRLDFEPDSGMNVIRMIRGKKEVKDGAGNVFWEIHDEIFKIYVGKE